MIICNSNGKCSDLLENVSMGVKLDKPWNEMWTIDVCELAICLRSFVQQHLGNLWQMHGWAPVLCGCTGNKTGIIKSALLFYIIFVLLLTAVQEQALYTQRWWGYCRKIYCSISHKSNKAQPSLLLHSPNMTFPALYEISLKSFQWWLISAALCLQPFLHSPILMWMSHTFKLFFSCCIQKNWWTD